jgi:hypothetical protein
MTKKKRTGVDPKIVLVFHIEVNESSERKTLKEASFQ